MPLSSVPPSAIAAGLAFPVFLVWFVRRQFQLQPPSKLVISERGDASSEDIILLGALLESGGSIAAPFSRQRFTLLKINDLASSCSPYVTKLETWLRFNNFKYTKKLGNLMKAPLKKLPCIVHNGVVIPDSNFVIRYLSNTFPDKVAKLTPEQEALSTIITQFCHQHLGLALIGNRWLQDEGFKTVLSKFFTELPLPLQALVPRLARKKVEAALTAAGWANLPLKEQQYYLERDVQALSVMLGDKPFLSGTVPSEADATLFGYLDNMLNDGFTPNCAAAVRKHANLVGFVDRIRKAYYPELVAGQ